MHLTVECFEEDLFQTDMKFEEKIEEKNLHCLERNVMSDQLKIDLFVYLNTRRASIIKKFLYV